MIWLVLGLLLVTATVASWIQDALESGEFGRRLLDAEADRFSTRQEILFAALTRPMTVAGIRTGGSSEPVYDADGFLIASLVPAGDEIAVDGRVYAGYGDQRFSVEDQRGLVNLWTASDEQIDRFLAQFGIDGERRSAMIAKLRDYTDYDDLYRLNGAEAREYRQAGRPEPANRPLLSPLELRRVIGWGHDELPVSDLELLSRTTTIPAGILNINAASPTALYSIPGMTPTLAERLVEARRQRAFDSTEDLFERAGWDVAPDEANFIFMPSRFLAVTLWDAGKAARIRYYIELTPNNDGGKPWNTLQLIPFQEAADPDADSQAERLDTLFPPPPGAAAF